MKSPRDVRFVKTAPSAEFLVRDGLPQVAFVGRSNVGKSSLINAMLRRNKLARTSNTPGRTRAVNYFLIDERYYFVDLPGYGYARAGKQDRAAWARLVEGYLRQTPAPMQVVLLIDAKIEGSPLDAQAAEYLLDFDVGLIVAATKIDRVSRNKRNKTLAAIAGLLALEQETPIVPVSAQTREGLDDLWRQLQVS